jgi:hypothetical protein
VASIANAPIPNILTLAGIAFVFIALGGQLGFKVVSDKIRPRDALLAGAFFLISGLGFYLAPSLFPSSEGEVFNDPNYRGNGPIDYCYHAGFDCGSRPANTFCIENGYAKAIDYPEHFNVPKTFIVGDGKTCPFGINKLCSTYSYIKCSSK